MRVAKSFRVSLDSLLDFAPGAHLATDGVGFKVEHKGKILGLAATPEAAIAAARAAIKPKPKRKSRDARSGADAAKVREIGKLLTKAARIAALIDMPPVKFSSGLWIEHFPRSALAVRWIVWESGTPLGSGATPAAAIRAAMRKVLAGVLLL